jgi:cold shock CspA family protein
MIEPNWQLGQIKFFDNDKGFGFVNSLISGQDYFVHISKIKTTPINDYDRVVFQLTPSRKKQGTLEAKDVILLSQFKSDNDFLIQKFSELKDLSFRKAILQALPSYCVTYLFEQELPSLNAISNDTEYKIFTAKVHSIIDLFEDAITKESLRELISKHVEEITLDDYRVQLWLENLIYAEPDLLLINKYFVTQERSIQAKIYAKLNRVSQPKFFENYVNKIDFYASLNNLMIFLQFEKQLEVQKELIFLVIERFKNKRNNIEESSKSYEILVNFVRGLDKSVGELLTSFLYSI